MNIHILTSLVVVLIGIPQILAVCAPNTVCENDRDTIIQLDATILNREKMLNRGRTWYIKPKRKPFNAVLAFKSFSSMLTSVVVIAYTGPHERSIRYFYGNLSNFEVVSENTVGIVIYVPISNRNNANFVLNYYTGCEILSEISDQISAQPLRSSGEDEEQTKCWFIQPRDNDQRKRIYFSAREVSLNPGQELAIWDIHTMTVIAGAENGQAYDLIAAETEEHQSVLIDLVCTRDHCNTRFNRFFISYYAMTHGDVRCIEKQKLCDEKDDLSFRECNFTCPAFDNMVIEEYGLQVTRPTTRLGEIAADEVDQDEGELSDLVDDGMIPTENENSPSENVTPRRQRRPFRKCPLPRSFCRCRRTFDKTAFCDSEVFCLGLGQCTFACIFHKFTTCVKIKLLSSLKLL